MDDRERDQIWQRLDENRVTMNMVVTKLSSIEAMLMERCTARGETLRELGDSIVAVDTRLSKTIHRVESLEKEKVKLMAWASCAGFFAAVIGWIVKNVFVTK